MMNAEVARIVRRKRREQKLSLRALADKSKVSYQTVFSVEQGKGSQAASMKVLAALGLPAKDRMTLLVNSMKKMLAV